jgi:carbamoyl-phosphate synthase large subunit
VLEANPRASRTVPLVSKVCGINMVQLATQVMLGKRLSELGAMPGHVPHYGVKEAVFPFNMFQEVDPILGPEMRSTGEVLGLADSFGLAFYKAQEAAQAELPTSGTVLLSVSDADKPGIIEVARRFRELGFSILATRGTRAYLAQHGYESQAINKVHEGSPNIAEAIAQGEIQLVINTPVGRYGKVDDSYIRKAAIKHKVPYVTTLSAALSSATGIAARRAGTGTLRSLQEYHARVR